MPDPEPVEVLVGGLVARVLDVLADGQVGEERVVLEDEPAPAARSGGTKMPRSASTQVSWLQLIRPVRPVDEAGDRVQDAALAGSGRPDERDRRADREAQAELAKPEEGR